METIGRLRPIMTTAYAAAADPALWPKVLEGLIEAFDARQGVLHLSMGDGRPPLTAVHDLDPSRMADYLRYYHVHDLWRLRAPAGGGVWRGPEMVPVKELLRSEWYNDFLRPQGIFHTLSGAFPGGHSFISLFRPRRHADFAKRAARSYGDIFPAIRQAAELGRLLAETQARAAGLSAALECLPLGILLVDGDGRVLAANRVAEMMLAESDGLVTRRARLGAAATDDGKALAEAVRKAAATSSGDGLHPGAALTIRRRDRRPLLARVSPLPPPAFAAAAAGARALIVISDPERRPSVASDLLTGLYGLTPREAELATELAAGRSLAEAAGCLRITQETARAYLKQVFLKTGTRRQAELVTLVLSGPAPFGNLRL
jgi:DNA-binding CsgD family transcriptional regulator